MPTHHTLDVQRIIDKASLSSVQRKAIAAIMAVSFFDGFDALIMAITSPAIAEEWDVTTASLTPAIVASLIGMIVGAILLAPRADRYGRRPVLLAGVAIFGAMTLCVLVTQNIEQIIALRFLAGIGLGAVIPNSYAYGAEFAPKRKRATIVTIVGASSAAGGFLGGLLASAIMPSLGWRFVFVVGGLFPLLLIPALLRWLPETAQFLTVSGKHDEARSLLRAIDSRAVGTSTAVPVVQVSGNGDKPSIKLLFTQRLAPVTLVLCAVFFSAVLLILFLMSWIPSVLKDAGFSTGQAVLASSICNLGAMVGGVTLGARVDRSKSPYRVLSLAFIVAAIATVVTALSLGSFVVLMISLFFVGACAIGTQMCVNAVATEVYPDWLRATGMGFLSAVGRVGSVVGPSIGGALLAAELPAKTIFLLAVIPAIVAAVGIAVVGVLSSRRGIAAVEAPGASASAGLDRRLDA
ncbi:MFS transporter [Nocardia sp. 348MFTsu5.1]|uniref:MFS transporter n=1 Tax=Nocardia sp. 348MFTsu5.1 TaxID=1172185 RepID=UPI0018CBE737|nr:MFS transporter [Nocardia sp. 348MFTsu5.1]